MSTMAMVSMMFFFFILENKKSRQVSHSGISVLKYCLLHIKHTLYI